MIYFLSIYTDFCVDLVSSRNYLLNLRQGITNKRTFNSGPFYYHMIGLDISNALKILSDQPTTQEIQFTLLKSSLTK